MHGYKAFLLLFFILSSTLFGADSKLKIYTLPDEARPALGHLLRSIDTAKFKIDAAIYSFTHKAIAKKLANAAKRGVKIRILFDRESNIRNRRSQIGYLSKFRNIHTYLISGKVRKSKKRGYGLMHMKLMVIDGRYIIFGSANWTYSAFGVNREILAIAEDYSKAAILERTIEKLILYAEPY